MVIFVVVVGLLVYAAGKLWGGERGKDLGKFALLAVGLAVISGILYFLITNLLYPII